VRDLEFFVEILLKKTMNALSNIRVSIKNITPERKKQSKLTATIIHFKSAV